MPQWWSWSLTAVGIVGLWAAGSKRSWGWLVGLAAQVLWVAYAVATRQYGFLASALAYGVVYARNFKSWHKGVVSVVSVQLLLVLEPFVQRYLYQEFKGDDIRHVRLLPADDGLRLRSELVFWDGTTIAALFTPPADPNHLTAQDVHRVSRALRQVLATYQRVACPACHGEGATVHEAEAALCPACMGRGVILVPVGKGE